MIAGIDLGNKKAGTTALCIGDEKGNISDIKCSIKGGDADAFLEKEIDRYSISKIFIDAPLSLPGVYTSLPGYTDYFFRNCDREIRAMSPMFLGGLTARAIKLKDKWQGMNIEVYEVWPSLIAELLGIARGNYKTTVEDLLKAKNIVISGGNIQMNHNPANWHEMDSVLAYIGGLRVTGGAANSYGDKMEGLIYV